MFKEIVSSYKNVLIITSPILGERWRHDIGISLIKGVGELEALLLDIEEGKLGTRLLSSTTLRNMIMSGSEREVILSRLSKFDIVMLDSIPVFETLMFELAALNKEIIILDVKNIRMENLLKLKRKALEKEANELTSSKTWNHPRVINSLNSFYDFKAGKKLDNSLELRHCACGNCKSHNEVILNISEVIPDYIDFNSNIIVPGCCGSCAILDTVKETLDNELKVDEDITDTSCFPEIPLENATYIFTMSITGVPDYFTGCFDVDTEYELKKVIK